MGSHGFPWVPMGAHGFPRAAPGGFTFPEMTPLVFVFFVGGSFFKMDFRRRPFNQKPLALGEIQKPIWRYFVMKLPSNLPSNVEKLTFRCHVRPNPAKVRNNAVVWSMPSCRTPPDLPNFSMNCEKTSFCEKQEFSVFQ